MEHHSASSYMIETPSYRIDSRSNSKMQASIMWSDVGLITLFWIYVALANVLWGISMKASLAQFGPNVFAPWNARLLQHLLLYPVLVGDLWLSRQIGWRPAWRTIPLQILCALGFAVLANPAMDLGEAIIGVAPLQQFGRFVLWPKSPDFPGIESFSWLGSATIFILPYFACVALLAGLDILRRYRDSQRQSESLQRSLSAAQLAALRMQLSPHTLFNLLHTIRGQVVWNPAFAQSMIVQLGDLLRRVLRAGESDLCRIQDEVQLARLYLELQQARFGDRLSVFVPGPETLPAVWVPSLILQPLVENAVIHGLAESRSAIDVRVQVETLDETLVLRVANPWAPGARVALSPHSGIGLKNIRERLAVQFGERASLIAGPMSGDQWVAEIRLPLLHELG
jgi:hypothetical protein